MKKVLYIKGSTSRDVRINKFLNFFSKENLPVEFIGWKRDSKENINEICPEKYIFKGGGKNNKSLIFYYPLWMIRVFLHFLFKKNLKSYNIIAVNFDTAFPMYLLSYFRDFDFIYEVYDQFALSYNFPKWIKKILLSFDKKIMNNAKLIIHVDTNRIRSHFEKTIVIENSPFDYFSGRKRSYTKVKHRFAVTGLLNNIRGIDQILLFAEDYNDIEFLFVGDIKNQELSSKANKLPNVIIREFMAQKDLFKLMENCCAIFSLYNPKIEINRLAASNKVYDAMMMGIPVITNKEVINSSFILDNNIGYVINYNYDNSWNFLSNFNFVAKALMDGKKGRELYLKKYTFDTLIKNTLLPYLI